MTAHPKQTPHKILQLSDLHILPQAGETLLGVNTEHYFQAVLETAVSEHPDAELILLTGDLTQEPVHSSYQRIYDRLQKTDINSTSLPGNHDEMVAMREIFKDKRHNTDRQTTLGNDWRIVCLNSQIEGEAGGFLASDELDFLEDCLYRQPQRNTLVAVHHHCIPCGSQWMDTMKISNGQDLLDIAARYPAVKAITNGHIHQAFQEARGDTQILGVPSTCFQFKPDSASFALDDTMPGYRWFQLYPDGTFDTGISRLPGRLNELDLSSSGY